MNDQREQHYFQMRKWIQLLSKAKLGYIKHTSDFSFSSQNFIR